MNFEQLLGTVDIVDKVKLYIVGPSDGLEIEKSEIFVNLAAGSICSKGDLIPFHLQFLRFGDEI